MIGNDVRGKIDHMFCKNLYHEFDAEHPKQYFTMKM